MNSTHFFTVNDEMFPRIENTIIPEIDLAEAAQNTAKELALRKEVIDTNFASEYSMREFISPLLIAAVKLMINRLRRKGTRGQLSLSCEKWLIGCVYFGPVDYSIVFDCLDIVLTEAKRGCSELKDGVLQNLLQQRAAKEFLAKAAIDSHLIGVARKRKYEENMESLRPVDSFGIVSDGVSWIFTKTQYSTKGYTVYESSSFPVMPGLEEKQIEEVLARILGVMNLQLTLIENNACYQKFKAAKLESTESILRREVTIGREVENAMDNDDEKMDDSEEEDEEDEEEDDNHH